MKLLSQVVLKKIREFRVAFINYSFEPKFIIEES